MRWAIVIALLLGGTANAHAQDGATIYTRCSVCHLQSGKGVPGAFPPLGADVRALATSVAGRRYLALVPFRGLAGPLTVSGATYRGVMPAQTGLDDAAIAKVLNHILGTIAVGSTPVAQFTTVEVAAARLSAATLTPAELARSHGDIGAK